MTAAATGRAVTGCPPGPTCPAVTVRTREPRCRAAAAAHWHLKRRPVASPAAAEPPRLWPQPRTGPQSRWRLSPNPSRILSLSPARLAQPGRTGRRVWRTWTAAGAATQALHRDWHGPSRRDGPGQGGSRAVTPRACQPSLVSST